MVEFEGFFLEAQVESIVVLHGPTHIWNLTIDWQSGACLNEHPCDAMLTCSNQRCTGKVANTRN